MDGPRRGPEAPPNNTYQPPPGVPGAPRGPLFADHPYDDYDRPVPRPSAPRRRKGGTRPRGGRAPVRKVYAGVGAYFGLEHVATIMSYYFPDTPANVQSAFASIIIGLLAGVIMYATPPE